MTRRGSAGYADKRIENNPSRWLSKRISIDALQWLATSSSARILHIFDLACNLINAREQILSLVAPQIELGPFTLTLPSSNRNGDSLTPLAQWMDLSSAVQITNGDLRVGSLNVRFENAEPWDSQVQWDDIRSQRENVLRAIPAIAAFATQNPPEGSLLDLLPQLIQEQKIKTSKENLTHSRLLAAALKPASLLRLGIRNYDIALCREGALGLAGLGVGFTPSGDDFVIGAMYATRILHSHEHSTELASALLEEMKTRTNRFSCMWLDAAADGKAAEAWHDLLDDVRSNSHTSIERSVERILAVGHTSGGDALAGFIAVLSAKD